MSLARPTDATLGPATGRLAAPGRWLCSALLFGLLSVAAACSDPQAGAGALRARKVALQREVEGLREMAASLEAGQPLLPLDDVGVAVDKRLVRELIAAQLPFEVDADRFHARLDEAEVQFRGSPLVRLRGRVSLRERPEVSGTLLALGALEDIAVDAATGRLHARLALDHLDIERAAGAEALLSGSTLDELARRLRLQIAPKLPLVQVPVRVQQWIDLPALSDGPVRLEAAALPLQVGISRVFAGQGRLWIGVQVRPGSVVKRAEQAPARQGRP